MPRPPRLSIDQGIKELLGRFPGDEIVPVALITDVTGIRPEAL